MEVVHVLLYFGLLGLLHQVVKNHDKKVAGLTAARERDKDELIRYRNALDDSETRCENLTEAFRRERIRNEKLTDKLQASERALALVSKVST